jgi:hypothetical protein
MKIVLDGNIHFPQLASATIEFYMLIPVLPELMYNRVVIHKVL